MTVNTAQPGRDEMTYRTYRFLVRHLDSARHIEVVACDYEAALADLTEAFEGLEVLQWGIA